MGHRKARLAVNGNLLTLEPVGVGRQPEDGGEGGIAVGVIDRVGNADSAVAVNGLVDGAGEDAVAVDVLEAGTGRDGEAGAAEAVVGVGEEIVGGDALVAGAEGEGETANGGDGDGGAGFEEVLIGARVVIVQGLGGAEGSAALNAVGVALGGDVIAVGVEDHAIADEAEALPLGGHAPSAVARLDGVVDGSGDFDDGAGSGRVGVDGVLDVVVAGGHEDADAEGEIAFVLCGGAEDPAVDSEDDVAEALGLVFDGGVLRFAGGEEEGRIEFEADAGRVLVEDVEVEEVDAVLDLGVLLGAVLLVDVADKVLIGELVAFADGDLEMAREQVASLVGGQLAFDAGDDLLGGAGDDAALGVEAGRAGKREDEEGEKECGGRDGASDGARARRTGADAVRQGSLSSNSRSGVGSSCASPWGIRSQLADPAAGPTVRRGRRFAHGARDGFWGTTWGGASPERR